MKAERMLYVPSKEKSMKRIPIMTESIESPEYLFSKIEVMSWLKDLPDLGSLLMDLSVLLLCFPFNIYYPFKYQGVGMFKLKPQSKKNASTVLNLQL